MKDGMEYDERRNLMVVQDKCSQFSFLRLAMLKIIL
jgi:hypothetical protein